MTTVTHFNPQTQRRQGAPLSVNPASTRHTHRSLQRLVLSHLHRAGVFPCRVLYTKAHLKNCELMDNDPNRYRANTFFRGNEFEGNTLGWAVGAQYVRDQLQFAILQAKPTRENFSVPLRFDEAPDHAPRLTTMPKAPAVMQEVQFAAHCFQTFEQYRRANRAETFLDHQVEAWESLFLELRHPDDHGVHPDGPYKQRWVSLNSLFRDVAELSLTSYHNWEHVLEFLLRHPVGLTRRYYWRQPDVWSPPKRLEETICVGYGLPRGYQIPGLADYLKIWNYFKAGVMETLRLPALVEFIPTDNDQEPKILSSAAWCLLAQLEELPLGEAEQVLVAVPRIKPNAAGWRNQTHLASHPVRVRNLADRFQQLKPRYLMPTLLVRCRCSVANRQIDLKPYMKYAAKTWMTYVAPSVHTEKLWQKWVIDDLVRGRHSMPPQQTENLDKSRCSQNQQQPDLEEMTLVEESGSSQEPGLAYAQSMHESDHDEPNPAASAQSNQLSPAEVFAKSVWV